MEAKKELAIILLLLQLVVTVYQYYYYWYRSTRHPLLLAIILLLLQLVVTVYQYYYYWYRSTRHPLLLLPNKINHQPAITIIIITTTIILMATFRLRCEIEGGSITLTIHDLPAGCCPVDLTSEPQSTKTESYPNSFSQSTNSSIVHPKRERIQKKREKMLSFLLVFNSA